MAAVLATAITLSAPAQAAEFHCRADILGVLVYKDGSLSVAHSARREWTVLCSVAPFNNHNNVHQDTCREWAKLLLQQKAAGRRADFYYVTSEATSCEDLPAYKLAPSPLYVAAIEDEPPVSSGSKSRSEAPPFLPPLGEFKD